ncbi:EamA family transporter [Leptolyngbya sp. FACHB-261]|uniref:EamA family transporter n=1 Tax=Leptolyngbya sp. FACHB-261 TaxID=2692806 RepID=UPI0016846001|nr:EamA family transporter [Leptolyngbya sp. FACHB-261]MBD2101925.1 EamA family transporter [Leptolyngbya sp. FACHB-261]
MRTWLALSVLVLADCAGSLLLTQGMKQVGEVSTLQPRALLRLARRAIFNPKLGLGVLCMTVAFFMFISLLSWADLSFVLPATALTEPINMLGTQYILKEKVTPVRWVSIAFICVGVFLISLSNGTR